MRVLLSLLCLVILSCSDDIKVEKTLDHAWDTSFFSPQINEKLIYQERLDYISGDQSHPITQEDIKTKIIKRVQIYDGPETIDGENYHRYSIYNDGLFKEGFVFHWNGKMLLVTGAFQEGEKAVLTKAPIPIASIDMTIGKRWHWPIGSPLGNGSRITRFEPVKVPAGTFDAYKISVRTILGGTTSLREYWFVPKIGIVKEKNHFYSGGLLRSVNTIELIDRTSAYLAPNEST